MIGKTLGHYRIVEKLAAEVWVLSIGPRTLRWADT